MPKTPVIAVRVIGAGLAMALVMNYCAGHAINEAVQKRVDYAVSEAIAAQPVIVTSPSTTTTTSTPPLPLQSPHPRLHAHVTTHTAVSMGQAWDCIGKHESNNNYQDHGGGRWQFEQGTWNGLAARHSRNDLVGVRPEAASPADQDMMAQWLYAERGWEPWPTTSKICGLR